MQITLNRRFQDIKSMYTKRKTFYDFHNIYNMDREDFTIYQQTY